MNVGFIFIFLFFFSLEHLPTSMPPQTPPPMPQPLLTTPTPPSPGPPPSPPSPPPSPPPPQVSTSPCLQAHSPPPSLSTSSFAPSSSQAFLEELLELSNIDEDHFIPSPILFNENSNVDCMPDFNKVPYSLESLYPIPLEESPIFDISSSQRNEPPTSPPVSPTRVESPSTMTAQELFSPVQPSASSSSAQHGGAIADAPNATTHIEHPSPNHPLYRLKKVSQKRNKKFNASVTDYSVSFNAVDESVPLVSMLPKATGMFNDIVQDMCQGANDNDMIRLVFNAPQLDRPISMPFVRKDQLNNDMFANKLESTLQSHEEISLDETVSFNVIHMEMPIGGKGGKKYSNINEFIFKSKSIIRIKNDTENDKMCCARAIVTMIARIENHPKLSSIRKGCQIQTVLASELYKHANISEDTACEISHIKLIENTPQMSNYRVVVVSKDHLNFVTYAGPDDREHDIFLYYHDNHYDLITSMSGFYNRSYFCNKCLKGYDNRRTHL